MVCILLIFISGINVLYHFSTEWNRVHLRSYDIARCVSQQVWHTLRYFIFLFFRTMQSDAGLHCAHLRGFEAAETNSNQAVNHASRMKRELCLWRYKTIFVLFFKDCLRAASPSPAICFNLLQLCSCYFLKAQRCGTYREWGAFARMHHSTTLLRMPYNLETCTALPRFMKQWHDYSLTQLGLGAKHLSALLAGGEGWLSTILLF